jgi:hypothetical protein
LKRLREFQQAFVELVNASEKSAFGLRALVPKIDEAEWMAMRQRTALLAGTAASAYQRQSGGSLQVQNFGKMQAIDPVANWQIAIDAPVSLDPIVLVSTIEYVVGITQVRLEEALGRERGIVGLLAAFLRWPDDLRDAVGGSRKRQRSAKALGVAGQVFVATLSTVLAAAIVGAAGQLLSGLWVG